MRPEEAQEMDEMGDKIEQLRGRCHRLTKERDAALDAKDILRGIVTDLQANHDGEPGYNFVVGRFISDEYWRRAVTLVAGGPQQETKR